MYYKVYDLDKAYKILSQVWKERREWNALFGNKSIVWNVVVKSVINQIRKLKGERL